MPLITLIWFSQWASVFLPDYDKISHLHKLSTSSSTVLLLIELQFWRFNPTRVLPIFFRQGKILFDTSEHPDKDRTWRLSCSALDRIVMPESVTAHFDTSRSLRNRQFSAIASKLASVIFLQPSRFSNSRVPPCSLAKAETTSSVKLKQPLRFTLTRPASQLSNSGRSPASVIPQSPLRSTCWSWGHSFPIIAMLALPNPGQFLMDKYRRELQGEDTDILKAISLIPMHFTRLRAFNFAPQFERAPTIPDWLTLLHSSNCRLSRDPAALAKATNPLSDTKQHLRRHICFRFTDPLAIASRLTSVIPRHEVIVKDINFCKPLALPMTQKPFSLTCWRPLRARFVTAFP